MNDEYLTDSVDRVDQRVPHSAADREELDAGAEERGTRNEVRPTHPVHRSSFIVHRFEPVSQPSQVVLAHQSLEDFRPGQESKAFAEESAAAKAMEM